MPAVSGTTRLYVVLGDPVAQVRAPGLLNPLFAELGRDAVLVPVHVAPADLDVVMAGLRATANLDGILVTVPHKAAVCRHAERLGPAAEAAGVSNALRREPDGSWTADNFDGDGFVRGLSARGHDVAGRRVWLVGAGGAGAAIAVALLDAGVEHVAIQDTDGARARRLADRLTVRRPGRVTVVDGPPRDVDIAVNATPLGMGTTDPLPFDVAGLPPGCLVGEIIMTPPQTALLAAAEAAGLPTQAGIHMLTHQIDSYRTFFGLG